MSKKRYVDTKFWDDNYIIEKDPSEKLLFLYLLTNTLTNIIGIYEISIKRIAFDTGIDKDMVLKILERFEADNKVKYQDGWIVIKNFTKHQLDNPKINAGMEALIKEIPDKLIKWANIDQNRFKNVKTVDNSQKIVDNSKNIDYDSLSHPNPNPNPNPNLNPNLNLNKERERQVSDDENTEKLKKETDPLEFSFTDKCWYELTDWRIKMFSGRYPKLSIDFLLEDVYRRKFLSDPDRYQKEIAIAGGVEKLVWQWLGQDEKYRKRKEAKSNMPETEEGR